MSIESAYQLLGLLPSASEADRFAAYESTRSSLESKLAKAPTPGLKEKYRTALRQMEAAIETIENSVDGGELPTLATTPRATPPPPPPAPPPASPPAHVSQPVSPAPAGKSRGGEVGFLVVLVIAAAAGGVWYMQKQNEANTAKAELDRGLPGLRAQLEEVTKQVGEYQAARAAAGQSGDDPLAASDPEQVTANLRSLILTAEHARQKEDWETARKNMALAAKELADLKSQLRGGTATVKQRAASDQAEALRWLGLHIYRGDIRKVRIALSTPGFDVNAPTQGDDSPPLVRGVCDRQVDIVALLLAQPSIDVNKRCPSGTWEGKNALLLLSSMWGRSAYDKYSTPYDAAKTVANLLLDHPRIDVTVRTTKGDTPLHLAVQGRDSWLASKILSHRSVDVNARNTEGNTPLLLACDSGKLDVVKILLTHSGIDVNAKNNEGQTPLAVVNEHVAAASRRFNPFGPYWPDLVKVLKSRGARE